MMEHEHEASTLTEDTSQPFVGRWTRLVSTTNWEKGRIIHEWRTTLINAGTPSPEYSDDAWSRKVGGVSGQHVGRLRRVYERFGDVHTQFESLYWSHFQAGLDWDDAEMWLEGAIQNNWSVSHMRRQRWETLGRVNGEQPRDEDVVSNEMDEDFEVPGELLPPASTGTVEAVKDSASPSDPDPRVPHDTNVTEQLPARANDEGATIFAEPAEQATVAFVRPFEHLRDLPPDVSEAFEGYKLAILRHKADGWQEISVDDVLASLDALKELALAPSHD